MIYKAVLLSSLLVTGAAVTKQVDAEEDTSEFYSDITSVAHPAKLLKTSRTQKKWVKFPEQLAAHTKALKSKTRNLRASKSDLSVVAHKDFFKTHAATFGLSDKVEMKMEDISPMPLTKTVRQRYEQYYDGVRVLMGDYIVNVGAHEGVLHAHGSTFSSAALKHRPADFERIKAKEVDTEAIHAKVKELILEQKSGKVTVDASVDVEAVKEHIFEKMDALTNKKSHRTSAKAKESSSAKKLTHRDIDLKDVSVELVVHPEWLGRGLQDSSLAYFVDVTAVVGGIPSSFQVSLDADSLDSRLFVDRSNRFDVKNADDYNVNLFTVDGYDSPVNLEWSSGGGDKTTGSLSGDTLVEESVRTANLLYSVSGGEYLGWNYTETVLNAVDITFDYQNAFFDGHFGVWFGPGFLTNDVIGHEWAHGYTQSMNDLFYYEDSGALNEAFSDIIGESLDLLTTPSTPRSGYGTFQCTSDNGGTDGYRWAMGEDTILGSIRDMYHPECFFNPSNHRQDIYDFYWCFDYYDGYGVHSNSGIMNNIFATMVDGGGQFITQHGDYDTVGMRYSKGIGMTKALNVIFAGYSDLTKYSVYQDAAVAIEGQCDLLEAVGGMYRPKTEKRNLQPDYTFGTHVCRRVKKILKRAYLFDDPINGNDCAKFCEINGCGSFGSGSYSYSYENY